MESVHTRASDDRQAISKKDYERLCSLPDGEGGICRSREFNCFDGKREIRLYFFF